MALIIWKDSFNIGFTEIDNDHHKLVDMINELFDAISKKEKQPIIEKVLHELIDYTRFHFKREEDLMLKFNYEDTKKHMGEHAAFIEKVKSFIADFKGGEQKVMINIINFLKDWLLNHIMLTDRKYVQAFQTKGYK